MRLRQDPNKAKIPAAGSVDSQQLKGAMINEATSRPLKRSGNAKSSV